MTRSPQETQCQCYDELLSFWMRERSSLITSSMLRIGSPRMTFCTSSASRVSCSTSASASWRQWAVR